MNTTPTIGFIGFGNMGKAIAQGLIDAHVVSAEHMVACAAHYDKLVASSEPMGVRAVHEPSEVVSQADIIIVAIKPYQIESVLVPIAGELAHDDKCIISLAAGWTLDTYRDVFDVLADRIHVQCTIPNTPIAVGKGVIIAENVDTLTDEQRAMFEELLSPIALIERVDSAHMNIAMCIAGCAPAFTDMYIEALGDAGVKYGLQRDAAYRLAAKMIEGVGALYLQTGMHPGAMKDAVCSPGGTTIKGVASLEANAFRGTVIEAVDAIEQG